MNRKSYSINLSSFSELNLKVPFYFNDNDINQILSKHKRWIKSTLSNINPDKIELINQIENFVKLMYLGKVYDIKVDNSIDFKGKKFKIVDDIFYLRNDKNIKSKVKSIYKENLLNLLESIYSNVKVLHQFKIEKIKLSNAEKRWGSCSSNGNINISWRLMMAPADVIYSVFAHELVHTKHFNHSSGFYSLLYSVDDRNKESDIWLNENNYILKLYKKN